MSLRSAECDSVFLEEIILDLNQAIFYEIWPNIRQVSLEISENRGKVKLIIYYSTVPTPEQIEYDIPGEIFSQLRDSYYYWEDEVVVFPLPQPLPNRGICVFRRYESDVPPPVDGLRERFFGISLLENIRERISGWKLIKEPKNWIEERGTKEDIQQIGYDDIMFVMNRAFLGEICKNMRRIGAEIDREKRVITAHICYESLPKDVQSTKDIELTIASKIQKFFHPSIRCEVKSALLTHPAQIRHFGFNIFAEHWYIYEREIFWEVIVKSCPSLERNNNNLSSLEYILANGKAETAAKYLPLFMPPLIEKEGEILLDSPFFGKANPDEEPTFPAYANAKGIDLGKMFEGREPSEPKMMNILAHRIQDTWNGWLSLLYPGRGLWATKDGLKITLPNLDNRGHLTAAKVGGEKESSNLLKSNYTSTVSRLLDRLFPEQNSHKSGYLEWIYFQATVDEILLYSELSMPGGFYNDKVVLLIGTLVGTDKDTYLTEQINGPEEPLRKLQKEWNTVQMSDFFKRSSLQPEEQDFLFQRIVGSWRSWLKICYPYREFEVEKNDQDHIISFYGGFEDKTWSDGLIE